MDDLFLNSKIVAKTVDEVLSKKNIGKFLISSNYKEETYVDYILLNYNCNGFPSEEELRSRKKLKELEAIHGKAQAINPLSKDIYKVCFEDKTFCFMVKDNNTEKEYYMLLELNKYS